MEVRNAVPADAAGIASVSARSTREAYQPLVDDESIIEIVEDPSMPGKVREWLAEVAGDDGVCYLVAVGAGDDAAANDGAGAVADERAVLGFAQCLLGGGHRPEDLAPDTAYLKSLYVDPEDQGEGVGTRLLEAVLERVQSATRDGTPVTAIELDVLRENEDARGFYDARGFEYVRDTTVELGGVEYETARYRQEL